MIFNLVSCMLLCIGVRSIEYAHPAVEKELMEKRRELKELRKEIENFQRIVVAVSKERDFYCRVVLIIVVSVITVVWYSVRRIKNEENKNKNSPPPDIALDTTDADTVLLNENEDSMFQ